MTVTVLLAGGDEPWESALVRALTGAPGVSLVRRCVDVADAVATVATGQARVALLSLRLPGLDTDAVSRIRDTGALPVALVGDDPAAPSRATALGMPIAVAGADAGAVLRAVAAADARRALLSETAEGPSPVDAGPLPGRLVAVWGPTGAPGRSTVALGIASEAAMLGVPTLLVDADVYGGSIAQVLAMLDDVSGLLAAARAANTGRLSVPELAGHVRQLNPMLRVLTGLPRADRWPALRSGSLASVLAVARQMAPLLVVDVGFNLEQDEELSFDTAAPRRNGATVATLEAADTVVVVGAADPVGIARLTRGVLELHDVVPGADVRVVVNKMRGSLGWSREQVAAAVRRFAGVAPGHFLPLDQAAVDRAWVGGQTLTESSPAGLPLRRAMVGLTEDVAAGLVPGARSSRRLVGRGARVASTGSRVRSPR